MAIPITTTKRPMPPRIGVFGPGGIGKTTIVSKIAGILMMPVEEGADAIEVPKTPTPKTWDEALQIIDSLIIDAQGYKAFGIDSVTALQDLCFRAVCEEAQVASIEAIGYGKGYVRAAEMWRDMLGRLSILRQKMIIVLIGHSATKKHEDPRLPAYDRLTIRLQINGQGSGIGPMTVEWLDVLCCAAYQVIVDTEAAGFRERTTATGDGTRILYCQERPAYQAKNRYGLPVEMPFDLVAVISAIRASLIPAKPAAVAAEKAA